MKSFKSHLVESQFNLATLARPNKNTNNFYAADLLQRLRNGKPITFEKGSGTNKFTAKFHLSDSSNKKVISFLEKIIELIDNKQFTEEKTKLSDEWNKMQLEFLDDQGNDVIDQARTISKSTITGDKSASDMTTLYEHWAGVGLVINATMNEIKENFNILTQKEVDPNEVDRITKLYTKYYKDGIKRFETIKDTAFVEKNIASELVNISKILMGSISLKGKYSNFKFNYVYHDGIDQKYKGSKGVMFGTPHQVPNEKDNTADILVYENPGLLNQLQGLRKGSVELEADKQGIISVLSNGSNVNRYIQVSLKLAVDEAQIGKVKTSLQRMGFIDPGGLSTELKNLLMANINESLILENHTFENIDLLIEGALRNMWNSARNKILDRFAKIKAIFSNTIDNIKKTVQKKLTKSYIEREVKSLNTTSQFAFIDKKMLKLVENLDNDVQVGSLMEEKGSSLDDVSRALSHDEEKMKELSHINIQKIKGIKKAVNQMDKKFGFYDDITDKPKDWDVSEITNLINEQNKKIQDAKEQLENAKSQGKNVAKKILTIAKKPLIDVQQQILAWAQMVQVNLGCLNIIEGLVNEFSADGGSLDSLLDTSLEIIRSAIMGGTTLPLIKLYGINSPSEKSYGLYTVDKFEQQKEAIKKQIDSIDASKIKLAGLRIKNADNETKPYLTSSLFLVSSLKEPTEEYPLNMYFVEYMVRSFGSLSVSVEGSKEYPLEKFKSKFKG